MPHINPETNRTIKIDGPTWRQLAKKCNADGRRQRSRSLSIVRSKSTPSRQMRRSGEEKRGRKETIEKNVEQEILEAQLAERSQIGPVVKRAIAEIDVAQWNMCMTGKHSEFRSRLSTVRSIGRGSFGEVYAVKFGSTEFVVKEAYLTASENQRMLKGVGRKGAILKKSYPEEYRLLTLVQKLLPRVPNFLYIYDIAICDGCQLSRRSVGTCYLTFMESAAGDLKHLIAAPGGMTFETQWSGLFQLLVALDAIHSKYGIFHRDIKLANVLYKRIAPGGYFTYTIDESTFHVQNTGVLMLLSDFGVADVLLPAFSGNNKVYGLRNARVVGDRFEPIVCKFSAKSKHEPTLQRALQIPWKDENGFHVDGTWNLFYGSFNLEPSMTVNLNDAKHFPPFEFMYDIQDLVRMFIGGKRTVQPDNHPPLANIDPMLKITLQTTCYIDKFDFVTTNVRFVVALQMLRAIYVKI